VLSSEGPIVLLGCGPAANAILHFAAHDLNTTSTPQRVTTADGIRPTTAGTTTAIHDAYFPDSDSVLAVHQHQQIRSDSRGGVRHTALKRRIRAVVVVNPIVPEAADSSTAANSTSSSSSSKSLKRSVAALRRLLQPDVSHGECYHADIIRTCITFVSIMWSYAVELLP
jgi:hypothetical protein